VKRMDLTEDQKETQLSLLREEASSRSVKLETKLRSEFCFFC